MSQQPQRQQPQPQQRRGSFSLFPSPNSSKPPQIALDIQARGRRSESVERRAITPQERRAATPDQSNVHQGAMSLSSSPGPSASRGRETPQHRSYTPIQFEPRRAVTPTNWPLGNDAATNAHTTQIAHEQRHAATANDLGSASAPVVQQPRPVNEVPGRTDTGFSDSNTLVRSNSVRSRSSIAKHPLDDNQAGSNTSPAQALRSIFPTYNPGVPLVHQEYAPTQLSPTHIPRAIISRQSHYYEEPESPTQEAPTAANPTQSPPRSPRRPAARSRWPLRIQTQPPPKTPQACTTEDLKSLWKVANGWQASSSEGRIFCLKLSQQKDAPVYTLSSATSHPFWNLRLDPTSTSAYVNLTRHDPSKPYKAPKPEPASSPSSNSDNGGITANTNSTANTTKATDPKNWYDALSTTLEEESRKHPPNDGLVALLMPTAATRMALERADDPVSVMTAENECGRLVWDEDTATHFLVHNALAKPFCVTIEKSPAYSRTEYTLEHNESSQHLAKLTKDGTGGGWIELDTDIASKIDSYYILDVAVTTLLLVAAAEERNAPVPLETFEPPPPVVLGGSRGGGSRNSGRLSKLSVRREDKKNGGRGKRNVTMEAFEIDVESQDDSLGKGRRGSKATDEDKLPFLIRVVVKLTKGVFKLFVWLLTAVFKCFMGVFKLLYKCLGSKY